MKHVRACVIGAGRFGSALARELTQRGCKVTAIDCKESAIAAIADEVDEAICGDVSHQPTLAALNPNHFDVICITVGSKIAPFLSVACALKPGSVDKVHCRVVNAMHRVLLQRVGVTHVMECEAFGAYHYADNICETADAKSETRNPL